MKIKVGQSEEIHMLPMSGSDSDGNCYEVSSRYLIKNKKPILPIMGEFHYARYPADEWETAICKMKAGGVQILATYIFWIHHEENKGVWDFTGSKDIRKFLELCKKNQMPVWLRIGPWAHGECRNGGYPDWLVEELGDRGFGISPQIREKYAEEGRKVHEARTNDSVYIAYVRNYWERISTEIKGCMCKDGGAVIGIQLENEYCHAGGPRDKREGRKHMETLKKLALELGFETPYYTATGWGGAIVLENETLPVLGGYVDAPWAEHIHEMPVSENFLIKPYYNRAEKDVEEETFLRENNPYLTAELGGGLQVTAHRRTYPFGRDIEAQSMCVLGAGASLLGYYMYHGGVNPMGKDAYKYSVYQESKASGYFNDLPIRSYDFEAFIHESGKLNESYFRLKKLHTLTACFGENIVCATAYFPDERPDNPEDMSTPRISLRYNHDTKEGFLFLNNHQRLRNMDEIKGLCVEIEIDVPGISEQNLVITNINCASGECAVIPVNLQMQDSRLISTNASLLAKVSERYYFYYDSVHFQDKPYFNYVGVPYEDVVVLTKEEAEHAYVYRNQLYITEHILYEQDGKICVHASNDGAQIRVYGEYDKYNKYIDLRLVPKNMTRVSVKTRQSSFEETTQVLELADHYNDVPADKGCKVYEIDICIDQFAKELYEIYLNISFAGDKAQLYNQDFLLTDWFANGDDWNVALKRYHYPTKLKLVVYPFNEQVYYDLLPQKGCELLAVTAEVEYKLYMD